MGLVELIQIQIPNQITGELLFHYISSIAISQRNGRQARKQAAKEEKYAGYITFKINLRKQSKFLKISLYLTSYSLEILCNKMGSLVKNRIGKISTISTG